MGIVESLPWSQITAVEITREDSVRYLDYLRKATMLLSLTVHDSTGHCAHTMQPIHSHLQALDLSTTDYGLSDAAKHLLDVFTLPSLKTFKGDFRGSWPHEGFMSLLARSGCSLEQLHITCYFIRDEEILECLRHVSNLSELGIGELRTRGVGNVILKELARDPSLVLGLETLCLYPSSASELNALVHMVR